jgi:hypothetical protein
MPRTSLSVEQKNRRAVEKIVRTAQYIRKDQHPEEPVKTVHGGAMSTQEFLEYLRDYASAGWMAGYEAGFRKGRER